MTPLRLLIVAEDSLTRAGLAAVLSERANLAVVEQTANPTELASLAELVRPDVILWDLGWDVFGADLADGSALAEVLADLQEEPVPCLLLLPDDSLANELWNRGLRGMLLRSAPTDRLVAAIHALAHDLAVLDPALADTLTVPEESSPPPHMLEALTPREHEVLTLLAEGLTNKAIARRLGISEHTAKFHVNAVLGKLGAQSRTEAVVQATRFGLIKL
jgi:DNA-binding NarL/FixJ family response regulator